MTFQVNITQEMKSLKLFSYLGGPADTSHLIVPLEFRLTFLMIILVGLERSDMKIPGRMKIVTGGDSINNL